MDVSARLINNQSSAVLTLTTSGDAYIVNANAIQVDINAPKITVAKASAASGAVAGTAFSIPLLSVMQVQPVPPALCYLIHYL